MISSENIQLLNLQMQITLHKEDSITELKSVSGGSINNCYTFNYANDIYFIKENDSNYFPEMFKKEASGLNELSFNKELIVPKPLFDFEFSGKQFLVLDYLDKIADNPGFFESLGTGIAKLHKYTSDKYGFKEDNYIGSLVQTNTYSDNWSDFFYLNRLEPLIKWVYDQKHIGKVTLNSFENLYNKLSEIFPHEKPSLLHGDLWSGNKMNTLKGPAIFDPAVYYGHREMDIAMTRLFGGFDESFYTSYNNEFKLEKDYKKRTDICNLYPLLVHVKLFGVSYLTDVLQTIKSF